MNSEKKLLFASLVLLFASVLFLSWLGANKMNDNSKSGWWSAYFNEANGNSLSFTIDNNSDNNHFSWAVYDDQKEIERGDVEASAGEKANVKPESVVIRGSEFLVKISGPGGNKEIYKYLK